MTPFYSERGVRIEFLGDSGPFSKLGTSICYKITYNGGEYLVDCGAAVFSTLSDDSIDHLRGIIATHSHEDHRRWFVDMALYRFYFAPHTGPLVLVASETVLEEYVKTSRGGLERTLSPDSKRVMETPFTQFVDPNIFGPTARYRIVRCRLPGEEGNVWRVMDEQGNIVSPDQAKVVVHPEANRPRMIFKDFDTGLWIEPEAYYPFTESRFYSEDQQPFCEDEIGISFQAVKSTAWHGPSTVSVELSTGDERIYFSSDTVFDPQLWKEMSIEVRDQKLDRSQQEFDESYILYGEINDFVQKQWSEARYERAIRAYDGQVLIHDAAGKNSVVHTDYSVLAAQGFDKLLCTHSPDHFVSEYPVTLTGNTIRIIGDEYFEEVDGELWEFDADIYYKEVGQSYVGYKSKTGSYKVVSEDGILDIVRVGTRGKGEPIMRVNLYETIQGKYFPKLESPNEQYQVGPDGEVYKVTYNGNSGRMRKLKSIRGEIPERTSQKKKILV